MDSDLTRWFETAIKDEKFSTHKIELSRPEGHPGGFLADVAYATITGIDTDEQPKEVHLICKYGKTGPYREALSLRQLYEREIYFYDRVLPSFQSFSEEKRFPFQTTAKCYATILNEDEEIVVLEDLKRHGYVMYDKELPMTLEHIRLVIDEYAKFHALSFALRDQRGEEFRNLTANYTNMLKLAFKNWLPVSNDSAKQMYDFMLQSGEVDLAAKLKEHLLDVGLDKVLERIFDIDQAECIIVHGDPNNNNFLFKHEGNSKSPTKAVIIDWQLSYLHSPVFDVVAFINFVSSKGEIAHYGDLLKFYYEKLTCHVTTLGSNIEDCYPLSMYMEHLEKYSLYALMILVNLPVMIVKREEYKLDMKEGETISDLIPLFDFKKVQGLLETRIAPLMKNYFNFKI